MDTNFNTIPLDQSSDSIASANETTKKLKKDEEKQSNESLVEIETVQYKPLNYHWFYTTYVADKLVWQPTSYKDSNDLENIYKKYM